MANTKLEALEEVADAARHYHETMDDGHRCGRAEGVPECDGCLLADALKKLKSFDPPILTPEQLEEKKRIEELEYRWGVSDAEAGHRPARLAGPYAEGYGKAKR